MAAPQLSTPPVRVPELVWVRPPQQARSQLTLSRILDATEAILAEKSWEDTGVAEIARRAGSSVGAFYTRFTDKDALLAALHQRFLDEAAATAEAALEETRWSGASICGIVRELVAFQVRVNDQRRGLLRALVLCAIRDPSFKARAERLNERMEALFTKLVVARRHEILHPVPVVAAGFVARLINAMLVSRLLDPKFVPAGLSFVDELTHAALAYLGVFPEDAIDVL
ncbi:MAG TPA: helix-turn-helix domain-containing protein [Myxococcota bacterium]|nr:helix-turn-helix domain-containing protein [Myxococcota bacterium]